MTEQRGKDGRFRAIACVAASVHHVAAEPYGSTVGRRFPPGGRFSARREPAVRFASGPNAVDPNRPRHEFGDPDPPPRGAFRTLGTVHGIANSGRPWAELDEHRSGMADRPKARRVFLEIDPFAPRRPASDAISGGKTEPGQRPPAPAARERDLADIHLRPGGEVVGRSGATAGSTRRTNPRTGDLRPTEGLEGDDRPLAPPAGGGDRPRDRTPVCGAAVGAG